MKYLTSSRFFSLGLWALVVLLSAPLFAGGATAAPVATEPAVADSVVTEQVLSDSSPLAIGAFRGPTAVGLVQVISEGLNLPGGGTVEFELVGAPDVMIARLVNQEVDLAVLPANLAARLYNGGQSLVLAAITGTGMLSVLSTDSSIATTTDLRGRQVHVTGQGSTPDYVLKAILQSEGLVPGADLTLDFSMSYPEITASLAAGRIETAVLPEPFSTMARMQNPQVMKVLDLQEAWAEIPGNARDYPMTALVVRRQVWEYRPEDVDAFLTAYARSLQWVQDNPDDAGALVGSLDIGIPGPVAARAIPTSGYSYLSAALPSTRELAEGLFEVLFELEPASIGGKLPDSGFYGK